MKKKIAYALIALALLAGVAIGHFTSQAVAGSSCRIDIPGSRIGCSLLSDNELYVTVYSPYKTVQVNEMNPNRVSIKFSK